MCKHHKIVDKEVLVNRHTFSDYGEQLWWKNSEIIRAHLCV